MPYTPIDFVDQPDPLNGDPGDPQLSAANLDHMQTQYEEAVDDAAAAVDARIGDDIQGTATLDADVTALVGDSGSDVATALNAAYARTHEIEDGDYVDIDGGETSYLQWRVHKADATGYAIHLVPASDFAGSALIGIGNDFGTAPGMIINNRAGGSGLTIHNQSSVTGNAVGFKGLNTSTTNPLVTLQAEHGAGRGELLQMIGTTSDASAVIMSLKTNAGSTIMDLSLQRFRLRSAQGGESRIVHTTDMERRIYAPNGSSQFAAIMEKVGGTSGRWGIHVANRVSAGDIGTETHTPVLEIQSGGGGTTRMGFFGATPVSQPSVTGVRAGNTALASLLTQLANLGLIANNTTAS